jgi:hypothetical protein
MPEHQGGEVYRVTLRALPADAPAINRLRAALKRFRRSFNFVATRVEELTNGQESAMSERERGLVEWERRQAEWVQENQASRYAELEAQAMADRYGWRRLQKALATAVELRDRMRPYFQMAGLTEEDIRRFETFDADDSGEEPC